MMSVAARFIPVPAIAGRITVYHNLRRETREVSVYISNVFGIFVLFRGMNLQPTVRESSLKWMHRIRRRICPGLDLLLTFNFDIYIM